LLGLVVVKVFLYLIGMKLESDIETVTNNFSIHAVTNKPDKASKRLHHSIRYKKNNMYHWSFEKQGQIVKDCDIVLIPLPKGMPLVQVKSPNRVIDGLQQGKFVIANEGVDSYEKFKDYICLGSIKDGLNWALNNKEEVIEKIKRGQQYIEQYHSAEEIGRRWIETENLV
jgi:glycosyltransferase involved in cell wall biosynthesis